MRNSAAVLNCLRLLLVTNHVTTTISLIGFCEHYRLSTNSMDARSFQCCSTNGNLGDAIVTSPNTWRLSGVISATAIGRAKH
eukprot:3063157-Pyramimonas_sp.AAC.1